MMKKYWMLALTGLLLVACSGSGGDDILSEDEQTLSREQVVGNWKETYERTQPTEEWVATTNPFVMCFDEDGTFRNLADGVKFGEGTWTFMDNKINIIVEGVSTTLEVLSFKGNEMEYAYYIEGSLQNYGRVVRTEEDEKPQLAFENQTFTVGDVPFTMVAVEDGKFRMGADDSFTQAYENERPQHWVTLSDFYIGETEVTQKLWKAVMGSNPSYNVGDKLPVEKVSWDDCQTFITKLNEMTGQTFRLPTEAEWEYAARGGKKTKFFIYSGGDQYLVGWTYNNSGSHPETHTVATKIANELGIYDMTGNVWEWCQDWYDLYINVSQDNPTGPETGTTRVYRGGSYGSQYRDCRITVRKDYIPSLSRNDLGLRLAMSR